jgi:hypothetical protein
MLIAVAIAGMLSFCAPPASATTALRVTFDECPGDPVLDYSGLSQTINNVGVVTQVTGGVVGKAGSFSGASYLTVAASPEFDFGTGDFTIDFWRKTSTITTYAYYFVGGAYPDSNLNIEGPDPDYEPDAGFVVYWSGAGGNRLIAGEPGFLEDGAWHHVALARENGVLRLFIDGTLRDSASATGPLGADAAISIGSAFGSFKYVGLLDEFRIDKGTARFTSDFDPYDYLDPLIVHDPCPGETPIPEPSTLALVGGGALAARLAGRGRR